MKINETQRTGAVNHYKKTNEQNSVNADLKKTKKKDELNISSEAMELLSNKVTDARIEDLKQSYSSGSYYVEPRKVAEKLFPYIK